MADVAEDQISHRIKQISLFLPNRLGALLSVDRALEAAQIQFRALSILDAADHAVVRLVVDQPTLAAEILKSSGHNLVEAELLAVALPPGRGFRRVLTALIAAEVNIHYIYSLMSPVEGRIVLALHVDSPDSAARILVDAGQRLLNQDDLT